MKIKSVVTDKETIYKIYKRHGIKFSEVKALLLDNPYVQKTRFDRYFAIGKSCRYITVIFSFENFVAEIVTAYPSSDWQIKLYKNKRGK